MRLKIALSQSDQLRAERDDLIKRAATLKPGSTAQTQVLKQLQSTTGQQPTNGLNGVPGTPGTNGLNGLNGVAGVNGTNGGPGPAGSGGPSGAPGTQGLGGASGSQGAPGPQGDPGPAGATGTNGTNGTNGSPPSGFTFTTVDGTIYDCTPDGGGHYTCTARPVAAPTP